MELAIFVATIIGGVIGCMATQHIYHRKAAYGYFVIDPVVDEEWGQGSTLGIKITTPLDGKDRIILYKQKSQE